MFKNLCQYRGKQINQLIINFLNDIKQAIDADF